MVFIKEFFKNLKFSWQYAKKYKKYLIAFMFINIFYTIVCITVPLLSAKVIINLTNNNMLQLLFIAFIIMLIEWLRNVLNFFSRYNYDKLFRNTYVDLQTSIGREILKIENKDINKSGSGLFIQRLTSDTTNISNIFPKLLDYVGGILTNIGIFLAIFIINKIVFVFILLSTIFLYFIEKKRVSLRNEQDKKYRKMNEKVSSFTGEMVRGIKDIKMLNSEDSFINELHNKVVSLNNQRYNMNKIDRTYRLISGSLLDLKDFAFIALIVVLINNKIITIANALIIYNYSSRVTNIIYNIGYLLQEIKNFNLSVERINEIMDSTSDKFKKEHFGTKHIKKVKGNFEFKDVVFSYDEQLVLNKINFKVDANNTVAFVGKSGAGKTTIFNLLCKLYDVNSGVITIDGIDINKLDKDSIRGNITIINQSPYIFNVSIRDNLRLVKDDLTDEDMIEACKAACLHDFIMELPNGYDTVVGEGGVNLSGGEKQRLAIARALVQKTKIILFDEATSALDNETQSQIQAAINNLKGDYTIIIIAHRLSTVINSDKIYVLNEGKIVGSGTHKELLKQCNFYNTLYNKDLQK